jgi:hypothetical protein
VIATSRPARIRVSTRSPVPSVNAPPISVSRPPRSGYGRKRIGRCPWPSSRSPKPTR